MEFHLELEIVGVSHDDMNEIMSYIRELVHKAGGTMGGGFSDAIDEEKEYGKENS